MLRLSIVTLITTILAVLGALCLLLVEAGKQVVASGGTAAGHGCTPAIN